MDRRSEARKRKLLVQSREKRARRPLKRWACGCHEAIHTQKESQAGMPWARGFRKTHQHGTAAWRVTLLCPYHSHNDEWPPK